MGRRCAALVLCAVISFGTALSSPPAWGETPGPGPSASATAAAGEERAEDAAAGSGRTWTWLAIAASAAVAIFAGAVTVVVRPGQRRSTGRTRRDQIDAAAWQAASGSTGEQASPRRAEGIGHDGDDGGWAEWQRAQQAIEAGRRRGETSTEDTPVQPRRARHD